MSGRGARFGSADISFYIHGQELLVYNRHCTAFGAGATIFSSAAAGGFVD